MLDSRRVSAGSERQRLSTFVFRFGYLSFIQHLCEVEIKLICVLRIFFTWVRATLGAVFIKSSPRSEVVVCPKISRVSYRN
jgi:hypothetical protein